ncbi:hypothetical protein BGZ61DRAFT_196730 [Ilyonectria robusta]|uniref:uncharacterized protein n=1 Tax=Ilyonectria robusta TaxID=1079257 RepID=UPI001E8CB087|nr:uncharacterized protein BGZ61DRAFT_196730 [Ilyonectria robusta]KAH8721918.1 hypothetical protein BGZ61DRAFT_196730 [Ilyonectria robusta]
MCRASSSEWLALHPPRSHRGSRQVHLRLPDSRRRSKSPFLEPRTRSLPSRPVATKSYPSMLCFYQKIGFAKSRIPAS